MIIHQKTLLHHGYFAVHAVFIGVTIMQDSYRISYVSKDYHTKLIPQLPLKITLKFNLLNLHKPYQSNPPTIPINNLKIQLIEFTYYNDKFSPKTITRKIEKYQPLIDNIINRRWNVEPLIVITAYARATTHISSMKILEEKFKISKKTIG